MKIIRFMSYAEAEQLAKGKRIRNTTDHGGKGAYSGSVGFCFIVVDGRKRGRIYHTARYMSGVVDMSACLVAEVPRGKFTESWGIYADYDADPSMFSDVTITRVELCTTEYSLNDFDHWAFYKGAGEVPFGSFLYEAVERVKCACFAEVCAHERFI